MKKLLAMLLAVLMLCSFACAEETVFTFRNGLHWGMTMEEVAAAEGKAFDDVEEISYTITAALLENVTISKFEAEMSPLFVNNQLAAVGMDPDLWVEYDQEEIEYLYQALCMVYGEADETLPVPEMVSKLVMASEEIEVLCGWQPAEDTYIALLVEDGRDVMLYYFNVNVDFVAEMMTTAPTPTPEPIITNGL